MSAHRTMPGDLTRLTGSNLKSADAHAAIPRRKQSRLLNLDGAATSWLFVTLPGSRAVSVPILRALKCGLAQGLVDLPTVEELAARSEVVAESAVTVPRVLFSQIGNPNTFVVPLNEF